MPIALPTTDIGQAVEEIIEESRRTRKPAYVTFGDSAPVVIMDAEAFEETLIELADEIRIKQAVDHGLADFEAGKSVPMDEAFEQINKIREIIGYEAIKL